MSKEKAPYSIRKAVTHGILTGVTAFAAVQAAESKGFDGSDVFRDQSSHTQDLPDFAKSGAKQGRLQENVAIRYKGRTLTSLSAGAFGKDAGHRARINKGLASPRSNAESPLPLTNFDGGALAAAGVFSLNRKKFGWKQIALLSTAAALLTTCVPAGIEAITATVSPRPSETAPATIPPTLRIENTKTPPPGFQTEVTPAAPVDIVAQHPDYHDASITQGVLFTHGATLNELKDSKNPLQLPAYALDAFKQNIELIQEKVFGEDIDKGSVFWSKDFGHNFVLVGRQNGSKVEVAVIAAGADNYSYHPNAEWFEFSSKETPKYTWVALPKGAKFSDIVGGYKGEFPVWGVALDGSLVPSTLFAPGTEHTFENNPAVSVDLGVAPEVLAALTSEKALNPDGSVHKNVKYGETKEISNFNPENISTLKVNDTSVDTLLVYTQTDENNAVTRFIWNKDAKANAWVPEFVFGQKTLPPELQILGPYEYLLHPELAPLVPMDAIKDGSANLSAALYVQEHPDCISSEAVHPYYKLNVNGRDGVWWYDLSLLRDNQYLFTDDQETILHKEEFANNQEPFCWPGIIRTPDGLGSEIISLVQPKSNPTPENPNQTINVLIGQDKSAYEAGLVVNGNGIPRIIDFIQNNAKEIVPVFLPPSGTVAFDKDMFMYSGQTQNPAVVRFMNSDMIKMFSPSVQTQLREIFQILSTGQRPDTLSWSVALDSLPPELSRWILYFGVKGWAIN